MSKRQKSLSHAIAKYPVVFIIGVSFFLAQAERVALAGTVDLPKTGQTSCYDQGNNVIPCARTGQDGETLRGVDWPATRFTDNGDGTIMDELTGLMWAQDGGTPTFGPCVGGALRWQEALDYVKCLNANDYLGYSDWRFPNAIEQASLAHSEEQTRTWLGTQGFSNLVGAYPTSTTDQTFIERTNWAVGLDGTMRAQQKSASDDVWPVRGGQLDGNPDPAYPANVRRTGQTGCWDLYGRSRPCAGTGEDGESQVGVDPPVARFTDHGDGTVTDEFTGLTWTKDVLSPGPAICNTGVLRGWIEAFDYIVCLNTNSYLGRTNWRIPNRVELFSLSDLGQIIPSLPTSHPFLNTGPSHYTWSSTSAFSSAFVLHINTGKMETRGKAGIGTRYNVWPVTDGPSPLVPDIEVTDSVAPDDDYEIDFGDLPAGTTADEIITVTNIGNTDLIMEQVGQRLAPVPPLSVVDDFCSGQILASLSSCTFTMRYSPTSAGSLSRSVDIPSDDPNEPEIRIKARGRGTVLEPNIRVWDTSGSVGDHYIAFGDVGVATSAAETVTVENTGTDDLVLGDIAQANPLAAPFSIVNDTCSGLTMAPSETCTLDVHFLPAAPGYVFDRFDIPSNDPDTSSITMLADGTGTDDGDGDGVPDNADNCPAIPNPNQEDGDGDNQGDACDACPTDNPNDSDGDGVCESADICQGFDDNVDTDGDTVPDGCDICAGFDDAVDTDADGSPDDCDLCPADNPDDTDGDGVCDSDDICPGFDDSVDSDGDGVPDGCAGCPLGDPDTDGDGECDSTDICPGFDDAIDADGDGVPDGCDICAGFDDALDTDGDGSPDGCDTCPMDNPNDSDSDGVCDSDDVCQGFDDAADTDGDGTPDGCDACAGFDDAADTDGDSVPDGCDNCASVANANQADADSDGEGDACEASPPPPAPPATSGPEDTLAGFGFTDDDGQYNVDAKTAGGITLAEIDMTDAEPQERVDYRVTDGSPPGPGEGTFAGFVGELGLPRTVTVNTSAEPGTFVVTIKLLFNDGDLTNTNVRPEDVTLHVFDDTVTPGEWGPAGNHIGQSMPTGVIGDAGYFLSNRDRWVFWVIRDELSDFSAGVPAPPEEEVDQPIEEDEPIGPAETDEPAVNDDEEAPEPTEPEEEQPLDEDGDSIPNDLDQCPNTEAGFIVDEVGCPIVLEEDDVPSEQELPGSAQCGSGVAPCGVMGTLSIWALCLGLVGTRVRRRIC